MPAENLHLAQAQKDERFYRSFNLATTEFLDWAVTGLFYSALHCVDAYLARKMNYHPPKHDPRTYWVSKERNLKGIYNSYRRLKDESEKARYSIKQFHPRQVKDLEKKFEQIKHQISYLLGL